MNIAFWTLIAACYLLVSVVVGMAFGSLLRRGSARWEPAFTSAFAARSSTTTGTILSSGSDLWTGLRRR